MNNPNAPDDYRDTYEALDVLNEKIYYWECQLADLINKDSLNKEAIEWHSGLVMGLKHAKAILMGEE